MGRIPKGRDVASRGRKRPVRTGKPSSPPGKRRLLVTGKTRDDILDIIRSWPLDVALAWQPLMDVIGRRFHGTWTRAGIAKHADLQEAFSKRQAEAREWKRKNVKAAGGSVSRTRDEELGYLTDQVGLLKSENADLKRRLAETEARMGRWRHNAQMHRLTLRDLDAPLQHNDRNRSDGL